MRNKRFILILLLTLGAWLMADAQMQVLTLDSCLSSAKQHNCTIRSAQLDVLVAREVKKQMLWKYFPQVSAEAFAYGAAKHIIQTDVTDLGLQGSTSDFLKDAFSLLSDLANLLDSTVQLSSEVRMLRWGATAQLKAVQPVYWGGQIVNANKLAKLGINAAELKQEVSERDVLQEVTETYWLVAGLMEKRATVSKASDLLDTISNVATTAYNHGLVTSNDLLRVQLKQNEIRTKAIQLENGIQLASRLLCHLIGQPYNAPLVLERFDEDETISELAAKTDTFRIDGRPETKLLELNVNYRKLMRKITLGESLPHLGIGITGGYTNFFEKNNFNALAFVKLSIPITPWGETSHKLRQNKLEIQQAEMMLDNYREKLELQNRQVYDQLVESIKLLEQHRSSRDMAKENHRVALMNYQAGIGTMTSLMEAEALLLQAENAYTDARISYRTSARKFKEYTK